MLCFCIFFSWKFFQEILAQYYQYWQVNPVQHQVKIMLRSQTFKHPTKAKERGEESNRVDILLQGDVVELVLDVVEVQLEIRQEEYLPPVAQVVSVVHVKVSNPLWQLRIMWTPLQKTYEDLRYLYSSSSSADVSEVWNVSVSLLSPFRLIDLCAGSISKQEQARTCFSNISTYGAFRRGSCCDFELICSSKWQQMSRRLTFFSCLSWFHWAESTIGKHHIRNFRWDRTINTLNVKRKAVKIAFIRLASRWDVKSIEPVCTIYGSFPIVTKIYSLNTMLEQKVTCVHGGRRPENQ